MSKQAPSAYVIIPKTKGNILPLQFSLGLPYMPMRTYPTEKWKYYPMLFSPQIWIGISVSLTLLMLNIMNDLNNLVPKLVL